MQNLSSGAITDSQRNRGQHSLKRRKHLLLTLPSGILLSLILLVALLGQSNIAWARWASSQISDGQTLNGISCPSSNVCYAATDQGWVYQSTNVSSDNATWTKVATPISELPTPLPLRAVSCINIQTCVAVGDNGNIIYTKNGGTNWLLVITTPAPNTTLRGVSCPETNTCYVVGDGGMIASSTDSGVTWTPILALPTTTKDWYALSCYGPTTCITVGKSGQIAKTTNGTSWQLSPPTTPITKDLTGIKCLGASDCYVVGVSGIIYNYNGSWNQIKSIPKVNFNAIDCVNSPRICIAVGDGGTAVAYNGANWTSQITGTTKNLRSANCPGSTSCLVGGDAEFGDPPAGGSKLTLLKYFPDPPSPGTTTAPGSTTPPSVTTKSPAPTSTTQPTATTTVPAGSLCSKAGGSSGSNVLPNTNFTDSAFQALWNRYDFYASGNRSYVWGSAPFAAGSEPYTQASSGSRKVLYFDKSRMEITQPDNDPTSEGFVTNGLLTVELVTGKVQIGDDQSQLSQYRLCQPANVPVAGDPDDTSGPRYVSLARRLNDSPTTVGGNAITTIIDSNGNLGNDAALAAYGVTGSNYVPQTKHTIAAPFWTFLNDPNQKIYIDGTAQIGNLFDPWYVAPGLPITEAFWARVKVGDTLKAVLIQAFERRVLTYTPTNSTAFQVEWGNIGRHYYNWRYGF